MLGRFISADSIIPGAASGSGGGAGTLGVDSGSRLTTLTTDFHEFIGQVTKENQAVLQYGPFFQWDEKVRKENPVPSGPLNPQALNRYAYCLNNPLRYVDPTGHDTYELTKDEIDIIRKMFENSKDNIKALYATGAAATEVFALFEQSKSAALFGIFLGWNAEYSETEMDSIIKVLDEAYSYASNSTSHTAVLELDESASLGLLTSFRCVGCNGTQAILREYVTGVPILAGPESRNPSAMMLRMSVVYFGKRLQ